MVSEMATNKSTPPSPGPRYAADDPTLPKPWKGLIHGSTNLLYYWNPESNVTKYEKPVSSSPPLPPSLGPCYAPDDPTLPKPWMGLIDGSTGILYYWNLESNVTEYEKPVSLSPPLPPPTVSTPKLAQIPVAHSVQPYGMVGQTTQPIPQTIQQKGQQISQFLQPAQATKQIPQGTQQQRQQHGQLMARQQGLPVAQVSNQQVQLGASQCPQGMQPVQLRPQITQHPAQQMAQMIDLEMKNSVHVKTRPLEFKPLPEKRKRPPYTGLAQFLSKFAEHGDPEYSPPVPGAETPLGSPILLGRGF